MVSLTRELMQWPRRIQMIPRRGMVKLKQNNPENQGETYKGVSKGTIRNDRINRGLKENAEDRHGCL